MGQRAFAARRPGRARAVALSAAIGGFYGLSLLVAAFSPLLVRDHAPLLLLLQPANSYLLLISGKVDAAPFVVIATLRRVLGHLPFFLLGRWYGDRARDWLARGGADGGLVAAVERLFSRAAAPALLAFPSSLTGVLAGSAGMAPRRFLALDLLGTALTVVLVRLAATAASGPLAALVGFIDGNAGRLTVVFAVAVALWLAFEYGRGRTPAALVSLPPAEALAEADADPPASGNRA